MKALLLIDIQNDFLPGGALAVPGGDEVVPVAVRLIPEFDLVVATHDWHPPDHRSFASQHAEKQIGDVVRMDEIDQVLWPDHCVQHTGGAELAAGLDQSRIHHFVRKGTDRHVDSYSAFFDNARRRSTGLAELLKAHDVDEVHIVGLATEYCVKATALDAVELGFRTIVHRSGIRGVEQHPGDSERAIEAMRAAGVRVI